MTTEELTKAQTCAKCGNHRASYLHDRAVMAGQPDPSLFHAFQSVASVEEEAAEYNRDLALRAKNGQVGSGMRHH